MDGATMTETAQLKPGTGTEDIVAVLLHQHEQVKACFAELMAADPGMRLEVFDRLRALLAMHETAEEMVLRPATRKAGAEDVADHRNAEEEQATRMLADLEKMETDDAQFLEKLAVLHQEVLVHAQAEEAMEFPLIVDAVPADERQEMGRRLLAVEAAGPTHPHPSTAGSTAKNWVIGPFASMVDHVRDASTAGRAPTYPLWMGDASVYRRHTHPKRDLRRARPGRWGRCRAGGASRPRRAGGPDPRTGSARARSR
jgi:hemerythrin superfamily protein